MPSPSYRRVRTGDLVGVAAPAGPVDEERLQRGLAELDALGLRVRLANGVRDRRGFTAGSAETRLRDLRLLLADPDVAAVFCARGGAGSAHLLPGLWDILRDGEPKALVGYSDATWLHLALARAGRASVHGPMVAWELASGNYDRESLWHALSGEGSRLVTGPAVLTAWCAGEAEGVLRGGCLSILAAAAGTAWALRTDPQGTILFIEDVNEAPYRIDRMLYQLRASGALDGVLGIVFGEMKGCAPADDAGYSLEQVLRDALSGLEIPVAFGLPSGHTDGRALSIPLGVRVSLSCQETARLEVLEEAVA
jgi:muramoyltetrapeptide carboxypeptidase